MANYTYGGSYGEIEGLNLAKDSARDSRYFQSLAAIRQAQQDAFNRQLAEQSLSQRADENAYNRNYTRNFDLTNLGLRREGMQLDRDRFDWQRTADRPVDERERRFDFDVAMERATRGDFATLPEVQVAHPKLAPSEQQAVLGTSLESRQGQDQDFNFASNAAGALKKRSALEGYLNMPDPSDAGWFSKAVAPGAMNPSAALKRPTLAPFYEDLAANRSYLDAIQKDKRFTDLLTPNPSTGQMEPTMQRPRWMTEQQLTPPTSTRMPLTPDVARQLLQRTGGDKERARALARQLGYEF